jgi:polar amino acid transport system substrate-binding protein
MNRVPLSQLLLICILAVLMQIGEVSAQARQASPSDRPLRVAVRQIEPFVFFVDNTYRGFSIELWQNIAERNALPYEFIEAETVTHQLELVQDGEADLAIAAISMTSERDRVLDFSYPMFQSGLQIMTRDDTTTALGAFLSEVFASEMLRVLGIAVMFIIMAGHVIWLVRRNNDPDISRGYLPGVWEGMWFAILRLLDPGNNASTHSNLGRAVSILWMFIGIIFIAQFTASISANLTVSKLRGSISGIDDLYGRRIATVEGSTSQDYLFDLGMRPTSVTQIQEAFDLLLDDRTDAIVYDAPVLLYFANNEGRGRVNMAGSKFREEYYGIAFPPGSSYLDMVNNTLLRLYEDGTYDALYRQWFG